MPGDPPGPRDRQDETTTTERKDIPVTDELSAEEYNQYLKTGLLPRRLGAALATDTQPKYGNRKVEADGITFDSQKEGRRYWELKLMRQKGEIRDLECHPVFRFDLNGVRIGRYTADFRYVDAATGETIVEDVKSEATKTTAYRLRKRLMKAFHSIDVKEV
jgi:hypothetical protein